ncbi:NlpC/P60 family protein [Amphiplicatus metriothermophilus]|uniref:Putative phage cell wall peptidase, NlpC/P60 family n=1 Tax=Amphiplicatus metriothermophilus TaxID=1519374 RepID=A0A239PJS0_9PROT|nr:NlpC/P60 family protein [Amphiplicatus metriothermophilus]MBB5518097.1 NlpC/P60 family putative phage cell wall peptidase [Amphiplicatus metriothermophilus]SNT67569.1 putative phage cell wall peptidase, NlpC/P60 family [Amphiplicatus metriothermophilus]
MSDDAFRLAIAPRPCFARQGEESPPAGAVSRARIVAEARAWLGTPYLHQASAKGAGTDCLGLIRGVWRALYGAEPEIVPPYTPDWNERAWLAGPRREPLLEAARRHMAERAPAAAAPGDALVFRVVCDGPAKHCGILSAPDRFIHAYAGRAVIESRLTRWWRERIAGAFAFPGTEEEE